MEGEKIRELALDVIVAVGGDRQFWSRQPEIRTVAALIESIIEETVLARTSELETFLDCRAGRLLQRGQFFVVVADDEPYFEAVYRMIREQEMAEGHWTDADEAMYMSIMEIE